MGGDFVARLLRHRQYTVMATLKDGLKGLFSLGHVGCPEP